MDLDEARAELLRNHPHGPAWRDDSFVGCLHEQCRWDEVAWGCLEAALLRLGETHRDAIPRHLAGPAARLFGYVADALAADLDPEDGYAIRDFDGAANALARERVRRAFEDFFAGSSADQ